MSKTIRKKISHAIQTTFRLSPKPKSSKSISCCSVKKPNNYEYITYEQKPTSTTQHDYIDLSECRSWSLSYSKDSGISNVHQLESTKINPDDSISLSTLSNLSSIRNYEENPMSFQCCRCQCHHYMQNERLFNEQYSQKLTNNKVYPFIF
ncbi:unnamed protein product [Adineta steineri]|uniref:Uncharacterized protein n=1 Tax=Adineta steineri TaxID=433720 RepID=A0A813WPB5_9BILA|nr:unnamed protein product [Adineta steineri]CAF1198633.1 unnamed protein product [Adineta steineri]CAF1225147.1 unnamed protein product [Adineta steineri]